MNSLSSAARQAAEQAPVNSAPHCSALSGGQGDRYLVRAEPRLPALFRARVRVEGEEIAAVLRNISTSGFMIHASAHLAPGTRVELVLPFSAPIPAFVRWSLNNQLGCLLEGRFGRLQLAGLAAFGFVRFALSRQMLPVAIVAGLLALLALR